MKSLLTRFRQSPAPSPPYPADEEIPRYPPFAKGLPAASVARILATQAELTDALRHTLALPERDFQTIVLPVVERYAAFTHLLPASEAHHHRGAGGLFRHGLEVAYWAALASEGVVFGVGATPRERKEQEPRWRLAVCLAGLLHDIGKPVSDLSVLDRDGRTQWNPYLGNLTEWAEDNGVDRYFLRWRDKRHQRHEQFSVLVAERVLTAECLSYLTQSGPDIMQAMLEAIAGVERGGVLPTLVLEADRKSVERDLKAHHLPLDAGLGVPVEKYLLDAMRRLVREGRWTANQRGGRVWRFADGLHVVWKTAAQEIGELLARDKVPGIPRDPDTLADILIERNLAVPRKTDDGREYRYWRMAPEELDIALYMLRLASPELIYPGEPPIVVQGRVMDEMEHDTRLSALEEKPAGIPKNLPGAQDAVKRGAELRRAPKDIPSVSDDGEPNLGKPLSISPVKGEETSETIVTQPGGEANPGTKRAVQHPLDGTMRTGSVSPAHASPAPEISSPVITPALSDTPSKTDEARTEAQSWLASKGIAGECLRAVLESLQTGTNSNIRIIDGQLWLPHPDTAQRVSKEPKEFLRIFDEAGWIETDLQSPLRKIREIDGIRGLMLVPEVSRYCLPWLKGTEPDNAALGKPPLPAQAKSPIKSAGKKPAKVAPTKSTPIRPEAVPVETARSGPTAMLVQDTLSEAGSVDDLIQRIRMQAGLSHPVTESEDWLSVPYGIIDWYVNQHPGLTRAKLIIGLHRHADCVLEGQSVLKVRNRPE